MSTTTNNFGFLKPELTDAADITAYNENWDKLDGQLSNVKNAVVVANSSDGASYVTTIPNVESLYSGLKIIITPDVNNTSNNPTIDVNNLGSKQIRLPLSINNAAYVNLPVNYLTAGNPVELMYDADYNNGVWRVHGKQKTSASDLYGTVPIESGGTSANNGSDGLKNLLADGATVLSSYQYGDELPAPGIPGRIFFKRVVD